ncbi:hypothetical protein VNO78_15188 [Psophocarpus tetragonolobus]|uniref:Thioredoxin domain-containing protein n=1 Tax=Psophocarpus tetragonolobus TaxID=3891 RepID=A0AAN9SDK6_PSOTE
MFREENNRVEIFSGDQRFWEHLCGGVLRWQTQNKKQDTISELSCLPWGIEDWNPQQAPMALNLCASPKCKWVASPSLDSASSSLRPSLGSCFGKINIINVSLSLSGTTRSLSLRRSPSVSIRSSLETAGPTVTVGQVTEVNKDTFWPIVKAAGDKTVVLDMYTQWCGPCKVMAPKFQELSQKYEDVVFLKLDCNQENKPLAKELGIKVVPTFKILKDSKVVKEVTGAKYDDLVVAIDNVRSS